MENKKEKEEGSCCGGKEGCDSGCGCGCRRSCCSGKAALALVLLLIGGLIGYGAGRCHSARKWGCAMPMHCPMSEAPSQATK